AAHNTKDFSKVAEQKFSESAIPYRDKLYKILDSDPESAVNQLKNDVIYRFSVSTANAFRTKVAPKYHELNAQINSLQRKYMAALMEVFPEKKFYPDANGTMRVTYGQVNGYAPRDAVTYATTTYLDGVMEKYV